MMDVSVLLLLLLYIRKGPALGYFLFKAVSQRACTSNAGLRLSDQPAAEGHLFLSSSVHLLPVPVVETTEPDTFDLLVAAATGVAIAVVSKDKASGAAGHHGVTTDGALQGTQTGSQTAETRRLTVNTNS